MTINQLIAELNKIEDKESDVFLCFIRNKDGASYYTNLGYVLKVSNLNTEKNLVYLMPPEELF